MADQGVAAPKECLLRFAAVLGDFQADPDDLIHAFGEVEENKAQVADLLVKLLQSGSRPESS